MVNAAGEDIFKTSTSITRRFKVISRMENTIAGCENLCTMCVSNMDLLTLGLKVQVIKLITIFCTFVLGINKTLKILSCKNNHQMFIS